MNDTFTYEICYDWLTDKYLVRRNYHDHVINPPSDAFNDKEEVLAFLNKDWFIS